MVELPGYRSRIARIRIRDSFDSQTPGPPGIVGRGALQNFVSLAGDKTHAERQTVGGRHPGPALPVERHVRAPPHLDGRVIDDEPHRALTRRKEYVVGLRDKCNFHFTTCSRVLRAEAAY